MSTSIQDLCQSVTDSIIEMINECSVNEEIPTLKWERIGLTSLPFNLTTNQMYSGANIMILCEKARKMGYSHNYWLTLKQANEKGWQIRKGSRATAICRVGSYLRKEKDLPKSEEDSEGIMTNYIKIYHVFNVAQLENGEELIEQMNGYSDSEGLNSTDTYPKARFIYDHCGAHVTNHQNQAFYIPSTDSILMPASQQFPSIEAYYSVFFHELTHWTAHETRVNRVDLERKGIAEEAFEELVAELGAAFMCAHTDVAVQVKRRNHAVYIKSWLQALQNNPNLILSAASQASVAFNYIINQCQHNYASRVDVAA